MALLKDMMVCRRWQFRQVGRNGALQLAKNLFSSVRYELSFSKCITGLKGAGLSLVCIISTPILTQHLETLSRQSSSHVGKVLVMRL